MDEQKIYQYDYVVTGDSYSFSDVGFIEAADFQTAAKISQEIVESISARTELVSVRLVRQQKG